MEGASAVCAGGYHFLVLDQDLQVWGCGDNTRGQLGSAHAKTYDNIELKRIVDLPPVVSIHAGYYQSFFIDEKGSVWACGENSLGQLGVEGEERVELPKRIPNLPPIEKCFSSINFTIFVDFEGQLWCCGVFDKLEANGHEVVNVKLPIAMKDMTLCKSLFYLLDENGVLWQTTSSLINPDSLKSFSQLPKIQKVTGQHDHVLLLDESGGVWSAGKNNFYQCGLGAEQRTKIEKFTKIEGIPPIQSIDAGEHHSILLDEEGCIWSFGYNGEGQLGTGNIVGQSIPCKIENIPLMTKIISGAFFTIAIDEEGAIWGSGSLRFHKEKVQLFTKLSTLPILEPDRRKRTKSARNCQ